MEPEAKWITERAKTTQNGHFRNYHPPDHRPRQLHQRQDLIDAMCSFIDGWNDRCQLFTWTKDPDRILAKAQRSTETNKDSSRNGISYPF
jgi:hypothetical protein